MRRPSSSRLGQAMANESAGVSTVASTGVRPMPMPQQPPMMYHPHVPQQLLSSASPASSISSPSNSSSTSIHVRHQIATPTPPPQRN